MSVVLRPLRIITAVLLGFIFIFYIKTTSDDLESSRLAEETKLTPEKAKQWQFEVSRDRNSHSLDESQCFSAFPKLYEEIDRAATFWLERNDNARITAEQIDLGWSYDGGLRCMIIDQQLYVVYSRGVNHFQHWRERSHATLLQIHRAIVTSPYPIPNIEFSIKINDAVGLTADYPKQTFWSYTRNISDEAEKQIWVIPDFNFWSYPRVTTSYAQYQSQAIEIGDDFESKEPQLIWRGTTHFNPTVRESLLQQSSGRSWANVHNVTEDASDMDAMRYRISLPDHCRYKFAAHTEGTTWSGRLKYLLSCHSVVLIHSLRWTTHLYHLLVPDGPEQNYQWVEDGWSNLDSVMDELLTDPDKARRIADNAAAVFRDRYMTSAAQTCYWRRLFRVWSGVSFEPEAFAYEDLDDGTFIKTWRGMALEEYLFYNDDLIN